MTYLNVKCFVFLEKNKIAPPKKTSMTEESIVAVLQKYNRKSECLYHDIETLSAIANKEVSLSYPRERLLENWKLILLNQFHDILPGSSIMQVYEDSKEDYEKVLSEGKDMRTCAENALISNIDLKNKSIVVFNAKLLAKFLCLFNFGINTDNLFNIRM